jgi:hypothetical protein
MAPAGYLPQVERAAGDRAVHLGAQRRVPCPHRGLVDAGQLGEQREVVAEPRGEPLHQVGLEVAVEVEGGDRRHPEQVQRERERRVPAGADLEQARAPEVDAGAPQVPDHDPQIVDLDVALALEVAQAAHLALQQVVRALAPGQVAERLLDRALDAPVHRRRRYTAAARPSGPGLADVRDLVGGAVAAVLGAHHPGHRDRGIVGEQQAATARHQVGQQRRLLVDEVLGEAVVAHRDRQVDPRLAGHEVGAEDGALVRQAAPRSVSKMPGVWPSL